MVLITILLLLSVIIPLIKGRKIETVYINSSDYHCNYTDLITILDINNTCQTPADVHVVAEIIDGEVIEVVHLGDLGILGSSLSVDNIETDWQIDQARAQEQGLLLLSQDSEHGGIIDTTLPQNPDSNGTPDSGTPTDIPTPSNPDSGTAPDSGSVTPATPDSGSVAPPVRTTAVTEYVSASNSCQGLGYVVYSPANANENTPIFLFMHGVGENGASYDRFIGTFAFLKYLINGSWQPDFILVAPIMVSGSNWVSQSGNLNALLGEVIANYGGSWNCLYAGGFSAGADAITPLSQSINFQGAIYMAGYLGGSGNSYDYTTFLSTWSGKNVFYFRDTFYSGGGYGYKADYVDAVRNNAAAYNVNFMKIDMDYGHVSSMVDAIFLPSYFMDSKGNYCHDAISDLIY